MNKSIAATLLLSGLMLAGVVFYRGQSPQPVEESPLAAEAPTPAANDVAPPAPLERIDFSLPDLHGNVRRLSDWGGRARLVNFWATWCAPCRREIPLLKSTQANYGENNMQVIGIAVDDLEPVQIYAEETDFNYPILIGQEDAMAAAEESGVPFIGLPFTMIVAPGGELLKTHVGEIVESHIDTILEVFGQLESGEIDLAGARNALAAL